MTTPPISLRVAQSVMHNAKTLGLERFHGGCCGPVAVAIQRVLFEDTGRYVVIQRPRAKKVSGHVAVEASWRSPVLFDYTGKSSLDLMREFMGVDERFEIKSGVKESYVIKHFCPDYLVYDIAAAESLMLDAWDMYLGYEPTRSDEYIDPWVRRKKRRR